MGQSLLVGRPQCIDERQRQVDQLFQRQPLLGKLLGEGLAPYELHAHEVNTAGVRNRIDRHDIRMIEGGDCPRRFLEPGEALGVVRKRGGQNLDRHFVVVPGVDRPPPIPLAQVLDQAKQG
jgi:hypothetical protein